MIYQINSSLIGVYFWAELRQELKEKLKDESELDLVILPGIHRSCTSVLFQCIYSTEGFQEKHPLKLIGFPNTEHRLWRVANHLLSKHLGAECFLPDSNREKYMADFFRGEFDVNTPLTKEIKEEMDDFIGLITWQDLKVIKEPNCQIPLQTWINNYECFRNAKYIWTRRDPLEAAKSLVRLKVPNRIDARGIVGPTGYRGNLKVKTACKLNKYWDGILAKIMPSVKHIEVWHSDLINNPKETFGMISNFLGKEINTEPFDRGKVWKNTKNSTPKKEFMEQ